VKKQKSLVFILTAIAIFYAGCAKPVMIAGSSMSPTFNDGDRLMMNTANGVISRGDVIMFQSPKDKAFSIINRVVGMPGENIEIRNRQVYINGVPLEEPYLDETYNKASRDFGPLKILENHYFVMGDNRDNSSDSRSWGTVDKGLVTGKYYATYWKAEKK
jgi:signal peptidase I